MWLRRLQCLTGGGDKGHGRGDMTLASSCDLLVGPWIAQCLIINWLIKLTPIWQKYIRILPNVLSLLFIRSSCKGSCVSYGCRTPPSSRILYHISHRCSLFLLGEICGCALSYFADIERFLYSLYVYIWIFSCSAFVLRVRSAWIQVLPRIPPQLLSLWGHGPSSPRQSLHSCWSPFLVDGLGMCAAHTIHLPQLVPHQVQNEGFHMLRVLIGNHLFFSTANHVDINFCAPAWLHSIFK